MSGSEGNRDQPDLQEEHYLNLPREQSRDPVCAPHNCINSTTLE